MPLRTVMLNKKRTQLQAQLKQLRAKRKKLRADEEELQAQIDALEEVTPELEQQVDDLTQQQTEVDDQIADLQDQIDEVTAQIDELEGSEPTPDDDGDGSRAGGGATVVRGAQLRTVESGRFSCRSRCFASRAARDAFYQRPAVKSFVDRARAMLGGVSNRQRRSVNGAELSIPTDVLDLIRDNLNEYSKLISRVRLRPIRGNARQNVMGDIPEGVWMEMAGALNELEFSINTVEIDGYKVGGVIIIDNFLLQDSDIALGEEIIYALGQSIGYALDKAVVYGKGSASKMPLGFVSRLAQAAKPDSWTESQGDWADYHSSHVMKLDLASKTGTEFFAPFLAALAKARPKKMPGEYTWIMNEATKTALMIKALGVDSAAALVSGMNDTMPILGGRIETAEFMPDNEVAGGYLGMYLLGEREGGTFGYSDLPLYIQDKTVFKGVARYDGQPIDGECFVVVNFANVEPTTAMSFAPDYANTALNALIVTSAAGGTKDTTILTVAGTESTSNELYANVSGAPAEVTPGAIIDSDAWVKIVSGTTPVSAANGSGVTVVEVDEAGKAVSVGYIAGVTSKTS